MNMYKEDMNAQQLFTSTREQKDDNNWQPNTTIGLTDASLETISAIKGGVIVGNTIFNTTKVVSPVIIQSGKNGVKNINTAYDDVTFEIIKKVNNVAPNITNRYIYNPTQGTSNINDFIGSALPGIPSNNAVGAVGWTTTATTIYLDSTKEDIEKGVELILSIPNKIKNLINKENNNE